MAWDLTDDRPIYTQILEKIETRIVCGIYKPGEKLPSVRDFAMEANVNPNTMQRAFAQLEQGGLIVTYRGNGRVVTEDINLIENKKHEMALLQIKTFMKNMRELGYTDEMISSMVQESVQKNNRSNQA